MQGGIREPVARPLHPVQQPSDLRVMSGSSSRLTRRRQRLVGDRIPVGCPFAAIRGDDAAEQDGAVQEAPVVRTMLDVEKVHDDAGARRLRLQFDDRDEALSVGVTAYERPKPRMPQPRRS